jgi:AraC-like DNA-binding protein
MQYSETIINKEYVDINPNQFGYQDCDRGYSFGPALRTHWIFHFVVSGKGYFKIEDREYYLSAGNIFVIPPFVETYYEADLTDPWEYIWVGFTMSNNPGIPFGDVIYIPSAAHVFEDMKRCRQMTAGRTEFLCSKISQLFAEILEQREEKIDYVKKALNIIHSEYASDISVQMIADRVGFERTYFSDCFKKQVGMSPKKYLLKYRMEQAAYLIRNHGYSVSITALSVGYSDVYTFSKMFKKYFGVSPSNFK